ncbi:MAG: lytic transglycosylase domain-containing protein [Chitinophagaceae bacterium]
MLKTTTYKACFIVSSFIFGAVASGSKSISKKPVVLSHAKHKAGSHVFDSSGLCTCIPFNVKEELVKAPRIQLNKNVAPFVKKYNKENGFFLGKAGKKSARSFAILDSILLQEAIPVELKYLAFIESGLKRNVISWAGAVGPWALMPVAAKQYGLKVSRQHDERLDYYKSTQAAAALLSDLYDKYHDWLLVIAAYNSGPGWVSKAIKRSGSQNYWALQQFLPEETKKHVKKFIAVHYYFEGHGSLVTMTKAETEAHVKAVAAFTERQQELQEPDSVSIVKSSNFR